MKLKLLVVVFFVGIICPVLTGCAVKEGPVYVKDGTAYGKPAGLFKEKWHDYFLRGVSYGDGGYWADAVADFRHAIAQRRPDQRRARTYGFHFVDYFPNRELGISLYHLGEFEKSVDALEASLASCESARAKYYVNKARRGRLQESGMDTAGPAASIKFPTPDYVTRDLSVTLRAAVQDNYYVSQLNVNGAADILELSQQEMLYQKEVPLKRGENRITLQAVDLVGNRSWAEQITVRVDREGPLVLLGSRRIGGTVEVTGAACDGSALVRLSLNSRELPVRGAYVVSVKESFEVAPGDYANRIAFAAEDRAGNRTSGYVEIESDGSAVHQAALPRLAFAGPGGGLPVMQLPTGTSQALRQTAKKASDETDRPIITVKGLTDGQTVFCDSVVVDGTVRANAGIKALSINGQSFFEGVQDSVLKSFMEELRGRKKRLLHFGRIIQLAEGSNRITVEAVDGRGRPGKQVVTLVRKTPRARQIGSRLTLSVYPFAETIKSAEPLERYVQSSLIHAFVNQKRFNILERHKLERLLQEQKISRSAVFDQDQAVSLGRLMAAETILLGDLFVKDGSVEVIARMVDTGSSLVLAEKDAYWEAGTAAGLRETLDGLALKFKQHFPLCEGEVIDRKDGAVFVNLGTRNAVSSGMRLLSFKENGAVTNRITGAAVGSDTTITGLLTTEEVHEAFSKTAVVKRFTRDQIVVGDKVITK